jgi:hypothetical protein
MIKKLFSLYSFILYCNFSIAENYKDLLCNYNTWTFCPCLQFENCHECTTGNDFPVLYNFYNNGTFTVFSSKGKYKVQNDSLTLFINNEQSIYLIVGCQHNGIYLKTINDMENRFCFLRSSRKINRKYIYPVYPVEPNLSK